jgi:hypothetical protein
MQPTLNKMQTSQNDIQFLFNLILDFAIEMGLKINKNTFQNLNITKAIKILKRTFKKIKLLHKKMSNKNINNSKKAVIKQSVLQNSSQS